MRHEKNNYVLTASAGYENIYCVLGTVLGTRTMWIGDTWVSILLLVQNTQQLQFKGKISLTHSFQQVQSMINWLQGQSSMVGGPGRGQLFTMWQPGSRERRGEPRTHFPGHILDGSTSTQRAPISSTVSHELIHG